MIAKEIRYRLHPGVEREAFLEAPEAVEPELETIAGYIRRELLEEDDGWFRDVVHWRSIEGAERSVEAIAAKRSRLALMDASSMQIAHLRIVQEHFACVVPEPS